MVNYGKGKVYKIEPICEHEEGEIYFGSTTKDRVCQRMDKHRSDYKRWLKGKSNFVTAYKLFDKYGIENCIISLIEPVHARTKDELKSREAHHIQLSKCVNKNIPGRTTHQYRIDNKTAISNQRKEYRILHKLEIATWKKQHYISNKDTISKQKKNYYTNNKIKIQCNICNCLVLKMNFKNHEKTIKHQNNLNLLCVDCTEYNYQWNDGTSCTKLDYDIITIENIISSFELFL